MFADLGFAVVVLLAAVHAQSSVYFVQMHDSLRNKFKTLDIEFKFPEQTTCEFVAAKPPRSAHVSDPHMYWAVWRSGSSIN